MKLLQSKLSNLHSTETTTQTTTHTTTSKPFVFDIPYVPSKIKDIFIDKSGSLNYTALQTLAKKLKSKNVKN